MNIPCICPGTPHPDGDEVTLSETVGSRKAATIMHAVSVFRMGRDEDDQPEPEEVLAVLSEAYVKYGIESWTVVDEDGKPVAPTPSNIEARLVSNVTAFLLVADEADSRYSEAILVPLALRASRSSLDTPTIDSTSQPTGSDMTQSKLSRPSLITTSQTAGTGTTGQSPDGVSSSSPSLASVG